MPTRFVGAALRGLSSRMEELGKQGEQAVQRAKSTVARRIKPEARRNLQAEYNLPAGRILDGLRSRVDGDSVELIGSGKAVNITSYGARWRKSMPGAEVQIKKGGAREIRKSAFIARGAGGNRIAMERKVEGGTRAPRYPLKGVYGPSIAQQLADQDRGDELTEFAAEKLSQEVDRLFR